MLNDFNFHAPSYIAFGRGRSKMTGSLLKDWGATDSVLVVVDAAIRQIGLDRDILKSIEDAGLKTIVYDKAMPNAPVDTVREGISFARTHNASAIVALGGGSAMDTAKAIAVMVDKQGDVLDYCHGKVKPSRRKILLFAIPTTCGTGSESTDEGVILEPDTQYKHIFSDVFAGPDVAILDPVLLQGLPAKLIAGTAMDAFSHSAEAYTCRAANVMMEPLALTSMRMIVQNIHKAVQTPPDLDALEQVLIASTMAGQAFTQVGLHIGHAIAHGIGVIGHVHHGAACAFILPYALESISCEIPERIAEVGRTLGVSIPDEASPAEIGRMVGQAVSELNKSVGICRLSDFGVTEDMLDAMAEYGVNETDSQSNSYRASPKEEVVAYLRSIL